jgi:hypothetical protein
MYSTHSDTFVSSFLTVDFSYYSLKAGNGGANVKNSVVDTDAAASTLQSSLQTGILMDHELMNIRATELSF